MATLLCYCLCVQHGLGYGLEICSSNYSDISSPLAGSQSRCVQREIQSRPPRPGHGVCRWSQRYHPKSPDERRQGKARVCLREMFNTCVRVNVSAVVFFKDEFSQGSGLESREESVSVISIAVVPLLYDLQCVAWQTFKLASTRRRQQFVTLLYNKRHSLHLLFIPRY